jgi:hypothetical protein
MEVFEAARTLVAVHFARLSRLFEASAEGFPSALGRQLIVMLLTGGVRAGSTLSYVGIADCGAREISESGSGATNVE